VYGYLSFSNGKLTVAYRTSDDDVADALNKIPEEEHSYSARDLSIANLHGSSAC
jgi:hypothetical protein